MQARVKVAAAFTVPFLPKHQAPKQAPQENNSHKFNPQKHMSATTDTSTITTSAFITTHQQEAKKSLLLDQMKT